MDDRFTPMRPALTLACERLLAGLAGSRCAGLQALWRALAALRSPHLAPARAPGSEMTSVHHSTQTE